MIVTDRKTVFKSSTPDDSALDTLVRDVDSKLCIPIYRSLLEMVKNLTAFHTLQAISIP